MPEITGEPEKAAERLGRPATSARACPSLGNVIAWDSTFFNNSKTTLRSLYIMNIWKNNNKIQYSY